MDINLRLLPVSPFTISLFKQLWLSLSLLMSLTFYVCMHLVTNLNKTVDQSFIDTTLEFSTLLLIIWLTAGAIGTLVLYVMIRPLHQAVDQAENIGKRRFTQQKLPYTKEFRQLVQSMNALSQRVEQMLDDENHRLKQLQHKLQLDLDTGLLNRTTFIDHLRSHLTHNDDSAHGILAIIRIMELHKINLTLGRAIADQLIRALAAELQQMANRHPSVIVGRLNGTDMAILSPSTAELNTLSQWVQQVEARLESEFDVQLALFLGMTDYHAGEKVNDLFNRVDNALVMSELNVEHKGIMLRSEDVSEPIKGLTEWRIAIDSALNQNKLSFKRLAVMSGQKSLIHYECHIELMLFGEQKSATRIMPWVHRLGWQARFDSIVVETAVVSLYHNPIPLSIHLCAASISSIQFRHSIHTIFSQTSNELLSLISIDIPESATFSQLVDFKSFCDSLKRYPCKIGIKHFGVKLNSLALVKEVGIDYLKLDYSLMLKLNHKAEYLSFVQGICSVAHSIGIKVFAPNIHDVNQVDELILMGIDGFTGSLFIEEK